MRLGHADGQYDLVGDNARQVFLLHVPRSEPGDDPVLDAHRPQGSHRGHVADLGDLLENQHAVQHRQGQAAELLRHGHPQNADLGQAFQVLVRKCAVLPPLDTTLEFLLRQLPDRVDHGALVVG